MRTNVKLKPVSSKIRRAKFMVQQQAHEATITSSASVVDKVTIVCFFDDHETDP